MRTRVVVHESSRILALLAALTSGWYAQAVAPQWGAAAWGVGAAVGVLFLASLLVHELAHAAVVRRRGFLVGEEHLVAFGGLVTVDHAADRRTEIWAGLAGAGASAALAAVCLALAHFSGPPVPAGPFQVILAWLGLLNAGVTIANLLPVFPLDGGRIAGRPGTLLGRTLGFAGIAAGVLLLLGGAGWGALWITAIGWLLLEAADDGEAYLRTSA